MTNRAINFTALFVVALLPAALSWAADPTPARFVSMLQDERDAVPYTSIVSIDPAEELRYRMALASDLRADRLAREAAGGGDALVAADRPEKPDYEQVQVTLIQPNLEKRELRADSNGTLQLASLMPGVNVLVATGEKAHGVQTLFVKMRDIDEPVREADEDLPVMTLISATEDEVAPVVASYASRTPSEELGDLSDIKSTVTADDRDFDYRVRLSNDGTLTGQLVSLIEADKRKSLLDTNVVLFRRGKPIARALTDRQGRFAFKGIEPDVYGIVVAGTAGYAAFSFEAVVEPGFVHLPNRQGEQFVSAIQPGTFDTLPIVVVPPPMVPEVVASIEEAYDNLDSDGDQPMMAEMEMAPAPGFGPMGGFGGAGPGSGGGGGGFGGGGGGDLAALAAVGGLLAAAAASSNDDNAIDPPAATSPVIPTTFGTGGFTPRPTPVPGVGPDNQL